MSDPTQPSNLISWNVILASPYWGISGVNIFSANLAQGLTDAQISAQILLSNLEYLDSQQMQVPTHLPIQRLPEVSGASWPQRWRTMVQYLEQQQPCIYIPNADFWHSCVSSKLSDQVGIIGIVHSDDPMHYDHVARLGKYWNRIVAVSETIATRVAQINPAFAEKLTVIPYGVTCAPEYLARNRCSGMPLRIVYAGRLVQEQKRVLDLPTIIETTVQQGIPIRVSIIGDGIEKAALRDRLTPYIEQGIVQFLGTLSNQAVLEQFQQHDVFILTSDFEGMPVSLLEAMGQGCVPVVTDIDSGIPEVIQDGINGYRVAVGNCQQFAERFAQLYQDDQHCRAMSVQAYQTIHAGGYRITDMVNQYVNLFHQVIQEIESGHYHRPRGRIAPPPDLQGLWKQAIPEPLLKLVRSIKRSLS